MFTVKQIFNSELDYIIKEEVKKKIVLESINVLNGSILVRNSYKSSDFREIELYGQPIFIKYNSKNYKMLLGMIFKDLKLKNNFTSEFVKIFIDKLISKIFEMGIDNVKKNHLLVDIFDENFHEVIVYIPIDGIVMVKDLLTVGKINLKKFTDKDAKFHLEKIEYLMKNYPHYSDKRKNDIIESFRNNLDILVDTTCVEFKIYADYKTALKKALDECNKSFDLIRYAIMSLYHKDYKMLVGLKGEVQRGTRNSLVCRSDFQDYCYFEKMAGALYEFKISDEIISKMRKIGFFKLSQILKKPSRI